MVITPSLQVGKKEVVVKESLGSVLNLDGNNWSLTRKDPRSDHHGVIMIQAAGKGYRVRHRDKWVNLVNAKIILRQPEVGRM